MHAIGRSRGGLSTKVHLVVDALGWPAHGLVAVAVADYVFDQFEAGPSRFAFGLSLNSVGVDGDGDGDEAGIESYTRLARRWSARSTYSSKPGDLPPAMRRRCATTQPSWRSVVPSYGSASDGPRER